MKNRKKLRRVLSLALCAAMLCAVPALADETEDGGIPNDLAPVRVWGRVTKLEDGGLLVRNDDRNDPYREVILHGESIRVLDAVSGMPLDRELKDGEIIYAWVGPAVTLSLPPHAAAQVIVANIPADGGAPQYYEAARVEKIHATPTETGAEPELRQVTVTTIGGQKLTVTDEAVLFPYLTKQMVTLNSLVPGSRILVWTDAKGGVTRVMLFAYEYQGYITWESAGQVSVNDQRLSVAGKMMDGEVLLPIRAVAEAAGYEVEWVPGRGAVVSRGGELVFSVLPGQSVADTADGETELADNCLFESGTTYLPALDLIALLNLFPSC